MSCLLLLPQPVQTGRKKARVDRRKAQAVQAAESEAGRRKADRSSGSDRVQPNPRPACPGAGSRDAGRQTQMGKKGNSQDGSKPFDTSINAVTQKIGVTEGASGRRPLTQKRVLPNWPLNLRTKDTDGDGWADEVEINDGSDPCDPDSRPRQVFAARLPVAGVLDDAREILPAVPGLIPARPPVALGLGGGRRGSAARPVCGAPTSSTSSGARQRGRTRRTVAGAAACDFETQLTSPMLNLSQPMKPILARHSFTALAAALFLGLLPRTAVAQFDAGGNGSYDPLHITENTTRDLPPDGIFHCTTISVSDGRTLRVNRNPLNTPVVLRARGDVIIAGTIDVSVATRPAHSPARVARAVLTAASAASAPAPRLIAAATGTAPAGASTRVASAPPPMPRRRPATTALMATCSSCR